jgi:hypothetical protein
MNCYSEKPQSSVFFHFQMTTINILQHENYVLATTSQTSVSLTVCKHTFVDTTLVVYIMGKEARAGLPAKNSKIADAISN